MAEAAAATAATAAEEAMKLSTLPALGGGWEWSIK